MKQFIYALLDPNQSPSSTTLIALLCGLTGIIISIISVFVETLQTRETVETSRWLIGYAVGTKGIQHLIRNNKGQ